MQSTRHPTSDKKSISYLLFTSKNLQPGIISFIYDKNWQLMAIIFLPLFSLASQREKQ